MFFAILLALAHHFYWQYGIDRDNILASFFDLDSEATIGSWFATLQWFSISVFALICFIVEKIFDISGRLRIWWLFLAAAFLVASADEASIIHETLGELLKPVLVNQGLDGPVWGYFRESPWLVFYVVPLFCFILLSLWFLSDRLNKNQISLYLCALAFGFYLVALVIEFVQGLPFDKLTPIALQLNTTCPLFYNHSVLIEETLENFGSTSLLVALLYYLHHLFDSQSYPAASKDLELKQAAGSDTIADKSVHE